MTMPDGPRDTGVRATEAEGVPGDKAISPATIPEGLAVKEDPATMKAISDGAAFENGREVAPWFAPGTSVGLPVAPKAFPMMVLRPWLAGWFP